MLLSGSKLVSMPMQNIQHRVPGSSFITNTTDKINHVDTYRVTKPTSKVSKMSDVFENLKHFQRFQESQEFSENLSISLRITSFH